MSRTTASPPASPTADGDYLGSVSDLMSGLLFLFIITLVLFALEFQRSSRDLRATQEQLARTQQELTNTEELRRFLVEFIAQRLRERGVRVVVDIETATLRLPEEVLFPLGSAELTPTGRSATAALADVLAAILPCFAAPPDDIRPSGCADFWHPGRLEAVFIEGHTDDLPLKPGAPFASNWELSAARAISCFRVLTATRPELEEVRNPQGQQALGVAGYADRRPVEPNRDDASRQKNRRIDVRFIMVPPAAAAATSDASFRAGTTTPGA